jgi:hypothetical protein
MKTAAERRAIDCEHRCAAPRKSESAPAFVTPGPIGFCE